MSEPSLPGGKIPVRVGSPEINRKPPNVVFVCRGNICRSPLALMLFGQLSQHRAISRGLEAWNIGRVADPVVAAVAAADGLRLDGHRAAWLSPQDVQWADLLVVMEGAQREAIIARFGPRMMTKTALLHPDGIDIADPYRQGEYAAKKAYEDIKQAIHFLPARFT